MKLFLNLKSLIKLLKKSKNEIKTFLFILFFIILEVSLKYILFKLVSGYILAL